MSLTTSGAVRWMITMDVASPTKGTVTDSACDSSSLLSVLINEHYATNIYAGAFITTKGFNAKVTLFPVDPIFVWIRNYLALKLLYVSILSR